MKHPLQLSVSILFLAACGADKTSDTETPLISEEIPIEILDELMDSATVELIDWDQNYDVYQGNYFSIECPSNFTASPLGPKESIDNYEFIDTDEATFTLPNAEVEFSFYSPLWGGEPASYLEELVKVA